MNGTMLISLIVRRRGPRWRTAGIVVPAQRTGTPGAGAGATAGIAEALVATAIGLFAAIPAVIAYNRFARQIDRIATQLESFIEEFSNILQRNAGAMPAAPR